MYLPLGEKGRRCEVYWADICCVYYANRRGAGEGVTLHGDGAGVVEFVMDNEYVIVRKAHDIYS